MSGDNLQLSRRGNHPTLKLALLQTSKAFEDCLRQTDKLRSFGLAVSGDILQLSSGAIHPTLEFILLQTSEMFANCHAANG